MSNKRSLEIEITKLKIKYNNRSIAIFSGLQLVIKYIVETGVDDSKKNNLKNQLLDSINESYNSHDTKIDLEKYYDGLFLFNLVQNTETILVDYMKLILMKYPQKMKDCTFSVKDLINSTKEELIERIINEYLNKLMYEKPRDYFDGIFEMLSIEPINDDIISNYIEIKARRDIGIHNNWLTNSVYLKKTEKRYMKMENELAIPDSQYLNDAFNVMQCLIEHIHSELVKKYCT